jgi:hypothetical protein
VDRWPVLQDALVVPPIPIPTELPTAIPTEARTVVPLRTKIPAPTEVTPGS